MNTLKPFIVGAASGALLLFGGMAIAERAYAQAPAETEDTAAPEPLSEADMEILVARIALYPDELVAVIVSASLYPDRPGTTLSRASEGQADYEARSEYRQDRHRHRPLQSRQILGCGQGLTVALCA